MGFEIVALHRLAHILLRLLQQADGFAMAFERSLDAFEAVFCTQQTVGLHILVARLPLHAQQTAGTVGERICLANEVGVDA